MSGSSQNVDSKYEYVKGLIGNQKHSAKSLNELYGYYEHFMRRSNWRPGQKFPYTNEGNYAYNINDGSFSYNVGGAKGCYAYSKFVSGVVYGTTGSRTANAAKDGSGKNTESGIRELITKQAQFGEHIRVDNTHSITFLGSDDGGFYGIEYWTKQMAFVYYSYASLASKAGSKNVWIYNADPIENTKDPEPTPQPEPTPTVPTGTRMASGYDRTLPDGDYIIANAANQSCYLDIEGSASQAEDFTNVHLWQADNLNVSDYDVWHLSYSNGFYTITQYGSYEALDVYYQGLESGTNVDVYSNYDDNDAQLFAISTNGRNGYRIQARCNGYSLDIENGNITAGTNIRTCVNNDSDAQSWVFIPYKPAQPIANGRYIITSALDSDLQLDVAGESAATANPTNVQIWDKSCQSKYNSFDVQKLDNGYYKLTNVASGKVLDLYGAGTKYNANVCVHDGNEGWSQQWAIISTGSGYALIPRCSGLAMDVENASTSNGANVQQWPFNGNNIQDNQTWNFVDAEYTLKFDANGGKNAPDAQTKYYKNDLTITKNVPTRSGYTFAGWKTNKATSKVSYKPGDLFKADANTTLYAHWESVNEDTPGQDDSEETKPGKDESGDAKKSKEGDKKPSDTVDTKGAAPAVGDTIVDTESDAYYLVLQTGSTSNVVIYVKAKDSESKSITVPSDITVDGVNYIVTEIAPNAFKNNKKLKSVTIGKNILVIGQKAFYGCKNLKNIKIKTTSLSKNTVGKNAFKGINAKAKVKVPKSKLKSYKKILRARGISGKKQTITK